jgi:hypothetical protein
VRLWITLINVPEETAAYYLEVRATDCFEFLALTKLYGITPLKTVILE